jgi:pre-mRNA-splicing factor ISY1
MARNEEKAQAMLNRWYKMKRDLRNAEMGKYREAPEISKCISIQDCEFERYAIGSICRMELLKVVSKKVSDI